MATQGRDMPLVTVSPEFQVTIPAKLCEGIAVREGDVMEATIVGDGILLRPQGAVDRRAVADRVASIFASIEPAPEDVGRSEDEIMADTIAIISAARKESGA